MLNENIELLSSFKIVLLKIISKFSVLQSHIVLWEWIQQFYFILVTIAQKEKHVLQMGNKCNLGMIKSWFQISNLSLLDVWA